LTSGTPVEEAPSWTSSQVVWTVLVLVAPPPLAAIGLLIRVHRRSDLRGALPVALFLTIFAVLTSLIGGSLFIVPALGLGAAVAWQRLRNRSAKAP
jgi:hypothetical protein